ncbi:MAG: hypothetical protein ACRD0C_01080 [Acidimicrobiia bacterium]
MPLDIPVQPGGGGHGASPADDPGTDPAPDPAVDGQAGRSDAPPALDAPSLPPPYAPVVAMAVDDGPPVPPELDDLLPPPAARRQESPRTLKGAKKGAVDRDAGADPAAPTPPPWNYGPVPTSPAPATGAPATGSNAGGDEVAAPGAGPQVKALSRPLTRRTARDSLAAMALTLIAGTGWNVMSARRRRHGWY